MSLRKIDNYAKLKSFKELSKKKQEAILYPKEIKPAPMPHFMQENFMQQDFANILKHFDKKQKQDGEVRKFYAKLFNDTKNNPHIELETKRDGELRKLYIKAYEYKPTHDLYYLAITKENDTIKVTGHPATSLKDIIRLIRISERASLFKESKSSPTLD